MSALDALVIYYSPGGNTRRVAEALTQGLEESGARVILVDLQTQEPPNWDDFDLVCLGAPSYHFSVPRPMERYCRRILSEASRKGRVPLGGVQQPGRWGIVFVTYAGPHTGIDEAVPAGDHMAQLLAHLGYQIRGCWYTIGAFHESAPAELNLYGFLGDIRGRPNEADLGVIRANAYGIGFVLAHEKANLSLTQGH